MCFRSLALSDRPIYAWHDVASAKVGRSRPRGSVLWLLPLQLMPVRHIIPHTDQDQTPVAT